MEHDVLCAPHEADVRRNVCDYDDEMPRALAHPCV